MRTEWEVVLCLGCGAYEWTADELVHRSSTCLGRRDPALIHVLTLVQQRSRPLIAAESPDEHRQFDA